MILRKYLIDFGDLTEVVMAFDFKKEYKEFYMPKKKPEIVNEIGRASCRERV